MTFQKNILDGKDILLVIYNCNSEFTDLNSVLVLDIETWVFCLHISRLVVVTVGDFSTAYHARLAGRAPILPSRRAMQYQLKFLVTVDRIFWFLMAPMCVATLDVLRFSTKWTNAPSVFTYRMIFHKSATFSLPEHPFVDVRHRNCNYT